MRKKIIGLFISLLFLVEYGGAAFIAIYSWLHINYKDIYVETNQFLIAAIFVHALVCLFIAAITGLYIHKKLGIANRKTLKYFSISALLSLPASILFPTVSVSFLSWLSNTLFSWIRFGWSIDVIIIFCYLLGIFLPSALSIRMAKIAQKDSHEGFLQQP